MARQDSPSSSPHDLITANHPLRSADHLSRCLCGLDPAECPLPNNRPLKFRHRRKYVDLKRSGGVVLIGIESLRNRHEPNPLCLERGELLRQVKNAASKSVEIGNDDAVNLVLGFPAGHPIWDGSLVKEWEAQTISTPISPGTWEAPAGEEDKVRGHRHCQFPSLTQAGLPIEMASAILKWHDPENRPSGPRRLAEACQGPVWPEGGGEPGDPGDGGRSSFEAGSAVRISGHA